MGRNRGCYSDVGLSLMVQRSLFRDQTTARRRATRLRVCGYFARLFYKNSIGTAGARTSGRSANTFAVD